MTTAISVAQQSVYEEIDEIDGFLSAQTGSHRIVRYLQSLIEVANQSLAARDFRTALRYIDAIRVCWEERDGVCATIRGDEEVLRYTLHDTHVLITRKRRQDGKLVPDGMWSLKVPYTPRVYTVDARTRRIVTTQITA